MSPMQETAVIEFIRYNRWANRVLLDACDSLSDEQLSTPILGAYGTIHETLQHLVEAEAFYISLLTGDEPKAPYGADGSPTVAEMRAFSDELGATLIDLASQFHLGDMVDEKGEGRELRYKALALFIQIVNHGVEHRTNITTVLNQGLQDPPKVDGWAYLWAHPSRFDVIRVAEE
jgi:uncharacterized damage-inducible protein DinB